MHATKLNRAKAGIACAAIAIALLLGAIPATAQELLANTSASLLENVNPDNVTIGRLSGLRPTIANKYVTNKNARIFGVVPNYTTVEDDSAVPPLTTSGKFKMGALDAFDPSEFAIVGVVAGMEQQDQSFGLGAAGYGKRYGVAFADQAIGNFMTGAILPSLLGEDPRYYRRARGRFFRRFDYALSRILLTRTDSGSTQFNYSEFLGNAAAAGISNLYSPAQDRTFSKTRNNWETQIVIDVLGFEAKEFWPDIRRKIFRKV